MIPAILVVSALCVCPAQEPTWVVDSDGSETITLQSFYLWADGEDHSPTYDDSSADLEPIELKAEALETEVVDPDFVGPVIYKTPTNADWWGLKGLNDGGEDN